ncbi:hypothetical protein JCM16814_28630 [Desulfobaculum senezii]
MNTLLRLDDFTVPGYGLRVSGDLEIKTADLSGETSGTATAEKGVKPKKLRVSCTVPFAESHALRGLIRIAEAKDEDGTLHIYTVANLTANAAGVRQAQFCDHVQWQEVDGLAAWSVSFTLREHMSVPERVETRQKPKQKTVEQQSEGKAVTPEGEGVPAPAPDTEQSPATGDILGAAERAAQTALRFDGVVQSFGRALR